MAKFTLEIENDYPCAVFGINATISDYRLCWNINKSLGLSLKRLDPLAAFSKANEESRHNHFSYYDESLQLKYHLIENKRGSKLFLPEVMQADYLLAIEGEECEDLSGLLTKLKEIRAVLMAFNVDIERLKQKQNLLYIE